MHKYFALYRPLNLFFITLAQLLCAYYLDPYASISSLIAKGILWLILGTVACSSFGYWINDFLDKERDSINKVKTFDISTLPTFVIYLHLFVLVILAVFSGLMLSPLFLYINLLTLFLLSLYSLILKNIAFLGNLLIAFLSFVSIFMLLFLFPDIDYALLFHFATLAGVLTLCRELVKDGEDAEGDRITGAKTVPIVFGTSTLNISVYVLLIFIISFSVMSLYHQSMYFPAALRNVYYSYYLLFILIPLYGIAVEVRYAQHKHQYAKLSLRLKYVLATGILSILFF
jgi:4-hydroxybenzoate polyprenyltransferase